MAFINIHCEYGFVVKWKFYSAINYKYHKPLSVINSHASASRKINEVRLVKTMTASINTDSFHSDSKLHCLLRPKFVYSLWVLRVLFCLKHVSDYVCCVHLLVTRFVRLMKYYPLVLRSTGGVVVSALTTKARRCGIESISVDGFSRSKDISPSSWLVVSLYPVVIYHPEQIAQYNILNI